ncbi:MAG: hypothetical protein ICV73_05000 [Acetobacteraceae bacterium]|nr:hypothetical protein [Acetobacteraceae bacterium]
MPAVVPGARPAPPQKVARLFLAGLAITSGGPKVIVFFLALLPSVVNPPSLPARGFVEVAPSSVAIPTPLPVAYSPTAARVRRPLSSPGAVRAVTRGSGATIAGADVATVPRRGGGRPVIRRSCRRSNP